MYNYPKQLATGIFEITQDPLKTYKELLRINQILHTHSAITILDNPRVSHVDKLALLQAITGSTLPVITNFLDYLLKKGELKLLKKILIELNIVLHTKSNLLAVKIFVAKELDTHRFKEISHILAGKFPAKNFTITTIIDPNIYAGVRVQVGDDMFDISLQGTLNNFAHQLQA